MKRGYERGWTQHRVICPDGNVILRCSPSSANLTGERNCVQPGDDVASAGAQFVRIAAFATGWATSASPSSLCCSRGIEKQTEKPSTVRSVTMPWVGSDDCSTAQDASGRGERGL